MESYSIWEALLAGLIGLGVIFWAGPGIKTTIEQSRKAESDWVGLLVPIGFVIIFVIFLVAMT